MSTDVFSPNQAESERCQDFGLKPRKSASPLPFKRRGLRRTPSVKNIVTSGTAGKETVVDYAFSNISPDDKCAIADMWADYQKPFAADQAVNGQADTWSQPLAGNFNQLKELKALYPNLKIMISIGGWTESTNFSSAASQANRAAFVQSCIDLFINWESPRRDYTRCRRRHLRRH